VLAQRAASEALVGSAQWKINQPPSLRKTTQLGVRTVKKEGNEACLGPTAPLHSEQGKPAACGSSLPHLLRHPIHGALKRKPSGIPVAVVSRPRCGGQFRLSFFRRRAGPRRSGEVRSEPQATGCGDTDVSVTEGTDRH
jgi:hypothetical protein